MTKCWRLWRRSSEDFEDLKFWWSCVMFSLLNSCSQKPLKCRRKEDNINVVQIVYVIINIWFHYHESTDALHDLVPHVTIQAANVSGNPKNTPQWIYYFIGYIKAWRLREKSSNSLNNHAQIIFIAFIFLSHYS